MSVEDGSCGEKENKSSLGRVPKLRMSNLGLKASCTRMTVPPVTQFRRNLNIGNRTPRMKAVYCSVAVNTGRNLSSDGFPENQQTKTILGRESKVGICNSFPTHIFFSLYLGLAFCPKRITSKMREDLEARVSCASGAIVCDVIQSRTRAHGVRWAITVPGNSCLIAASYRSMQRCAK